MLFDGSKAITKEVRSADVLIVGAGAVGLVLGISLARSGLRVTIVEEGLATPSLNFMDANSGPNTGVPHKGLREGRIKALGGTTRLWGGQLVQFDRSDFYRSLPGKAGWPIGYDEIAPYFEKAFSFLGILPDETDQGHVWAKLQQHKPDFGPNLQVALNIWLPNPDFTKLFGDDILQLETLSIVTGMRARRLVFDDHGKVVGIQCRSSAGQDEGFSGLHVVLANGTMEIARTLLGAASTADCPFRGNPHIGRYFIDHLHGIVGRIENVDSKRLRTIFEDIYVNGRKYSVKMRASEQFLDARAIANCAATINAGASIRQIVGDTWELLRRLFSGGNLRELPGTLSRAYTTLAILTPIIWNYLIKRRSYALFHHGIYLGLEIEQIATVESRLFLDPDFAPEDAPVGIHWVLDGRELDAACEFCAEVAARFEEFGLGRVVLDPRVAARDPSLLAEFHDAYHHMGGVRMAASEEFGVVSPDLRVFRTPNLWVLGAAVFPSGSFANPTLTAMAFAHRLADRLLSELKETKQKLPC